MNNPLISVVIPTKDRPHILRENLESCLSQTFGDFEVIVVDNSANAIATREAVAAFTDSRVKYVRTGGLNMPDNWDAALRQGTGKYVYIISDKFILHPITLENVARGIETTGLDVLGFCDNEVTRFKHLKRLKWEVFDSAPLIESLSRGKQYQPSLRGYGLILSRKYIEELLTRYDRIAMPMSPDYTMGYFALLNCKHFAYCNERFFRFNSQSTSNGMSVMYGGNLAEQFVKDLGKSEEYLLEYVPLKVRTIGNTLINDAIRICKICGVEYHMEKPELIQYWKGIYSELVFTIAKFHVDRTDDFRKCFNFAEENFFISDKEVLDHIENNSFVRPSMMSSIMTSLNTPVGKRIERKCKKWFKPTWMKIRGKIS